MSPESLSHGPRSVGAAGSDDASDVEVARVLESYLAALDAGLPADPRRLLENHPDLADRLRACLRVLQVAEQAAQEVTSAPGVLPGRPIAALPQGSGTQISSLSTLDFGPGEPPHIVLHEPAEEREPLLKPRSTEMPAPGGASLGRYQLQGEIARGGMGAILKGRDVDLGRDLAIKVLLEAQRDNPEVVRRFVEEAQIGGQLQHPGIVPVYELGAFPDRRPYFAMKLVKGRTLASLLQERAGRGSLLPSPRPVGERVAEGRVRGIRVGRGSPDPAHRPTEGLPPTHDDLPRFLSIFEAVCQTMAYAHARGVIHRDLKPSNIMVGSFGEVQVMDWGLAKVLPVGGVADEARGEAAQQTVIMTVRSGSAGSGSQSQAGSVLGTPSYMAPEQARGEVERIDERADVFGLGAILYEILTGRPPYAGSTREEIRARAARGDLADARGRLEACGADAELIGLARDCLAAELDQRPRSAGEVARRISGYLAGVQERLQAAELARVEAQTRAEEAQARAVIERSRRRRTVALAASVLGLVLLAGGGWTYLTRQRQAQLARIDRALNRAEVLYTEAQQAGDDPARWITARDAAQAVEGLLIDAPDEPTRRHMTALVREVTQAAVAAETDQKLLAKLVDIRSAKADDLDGSMTDMDYANAFTEAGIDTAALSPAEVGAKIRARPATVRVALAAALDDWAAVRRGKRGDKAGAQRLTEVASPADPDPWRNRLRHALQAASKRERLADLKDLAKSARVEEMPAVSLNQLGAALRDAGELTGAEGVLREAQRRHPGDVWLNYNLAECLERLARCDEAIRYYMAARSLRPETAHDLAHALEAKGEADQAIGVFQDLARLRPKEARHLACLGRALRSRGRKQEADAVLDAAIAAARAAVTLQPGRPLAHFHLSLALSYRGKLDEAIAECREAIRLKPDLPGAHSNLGEGLLEQGKLAEAIAEFRAALRLKPDFTQAHSSLGFALSEQGKLEEAIAECREAIRLEPDYAPAHGNLGGALRSQGKLEEAIAECREAIRLKPDLPGPHMNLGISLVKQGKLDEAIAEFRAALRLKPEDPKAHNNLGGALIYRGKLEEAIAEFRAALRLKPDHPDAHSNLGGALYYQGKLEEAIAEFRAALRLKPDYAEAHCNLGLALRDQGKLEAAIAEFRAALGLNPDDADAHSNLGRALHKVGKLEEAIAEFHAALRLKPDDADAHSSLGNALREQGKLDEAIAECRAAIDLKPNFPEARVNLGNALKDQGKLDEAIAEYRAAVRLKPGLAEARNNLGNELRDRGKLDEAIAEYRAALRFKPDFAPTHNNLSIALAIQGKLEEAIAECREALRLEPDLPEAHETFGNVLAMQGKIEGAIAEYHEALRLKPDSPTTHANFGRALRSRGEFREAIIEIRKACDLAKTNPLLTQRLERELTATEQTASLAARLPAVLAGDLKPADASETLGFAQLCYEKKLHGASARFWTEAFQTQPKLADEMQAGHRYNAACAAAMAGCGQGKDDPPLDEAAKARWRKQALDWLKADLAAWSKVLASGPPQARQHVAQTLQHWKADPDLAGLREPAALAKLPEAEQNACRALWAEVDALLAKARGDTAP
jgi:serine/threonine-protein kinase